MTQPANNDDPKPQGKLGAILTHPLVKASLGGLIGGAFSLGMAYATIRADSQQRMVMITDSKQHIAKLQIDARKLMSDQQKINDYRMSGEIFTRRQAQDMKLELMRYAEERSEKSVNRLDARMGRIEDKLDRLIESRLK